MSAPFAVYGAALGGSCRQVKLELNKRELAETETDFGSSDAFQLVPSYPQISGAWRAFLSSQFQIIPA